MYVLTRLEELIAAYLSLLDNVATFLLTFALVYAIGRYVVLPLVSAALDYRDTERTLQRGLERVVAFGVIAAAIVVGLSIAGLSFVLDRAAILVAALTVALGFAAQNVVGNFVSGAFIVTDPSFNIGDWIRWSDQEGIIEDISFRSTRVRTLDNETITVPNSELTANAVTNAVLNDRLRLTFPIAVSYDADLDAITRILTDAAVDHPDILADPQPTARIAALDDAVQVVASFWIADPDRSTYARVRSEYAREIVDRLEREGIDLAAATPQALEQSAAAGPRSAIHARTDDTDSGTDE
ncbi:mechanosensitive ion channel family protein [Haloterrigena sp. SYSU A558-1]|uniref:Mechanosensitive ion channel family protein n=1 Tax=Haloterrigena gelatinilytica TaxID=2741724 RepID=A0ABX2LIP4_9EURY|nr:mechanosensitive ion channel family protein [Haloterrigena gelatinilytica]NUC73502.1 mechanosensitive ion channel family protein [Haloterrigena gelatinilytica]